MRVRLFSIIAVVTLKVHVAQVKDGSQQFGDFPGIILCEREDLQS